MSYCFKCGNKMTETTGVCSRCGCDQNEINNLRNLGALSIYCPKCGKNNKASERFCQECGYIFTDIFAGTDTDSSTTASKKKIDFDFDEGEDTDSSTGKNHNTGKSGGSSFGSTKQKGSGKRFFKKAVTKTGPVIVTILEVFCLVAVLIFLFRKFVKVETDGTIEKPVPITSVSVSSDKSSVKTTTDKDEAAPVTEDVKGHDIFVAALKDALESGNLPGATQKELSAKSGSGNADYFGMADIDGDGKEELLFTYSSEGKVYVYEYDEKGRTVNIKSVNPATAVYYDNGYFTVYKDGNEGADNEIIRPCALYYGSLDHYVGDIKAEMDFLPDEEINDADGDGVLYLVPDLNSNLPQSALVDKEQYDAFVKKLGNRVEYAVYELSEEGIAAAESGLENLSGT